MSKKLNILNLFFEEPNREFNVREVARILKISPTTASKELKNLAKKALLEERKERIFNLYKANLDNEDYKDAKRYYNINKLKNSGLIERLNKFYLKPVIVLFGSYAFGLDIETSDIDLLIISEKTSKFDNIKKFENKLKRKLQIFNVRAVKELKNKELINNVINGIVIQGKIKWI